MPQRLWNAEEEERTLEKDRKLFLLNVNAFRDLNVCALTTFVLIF
jgi:hypothetical protein